MKISVVLKNKTIIEVKDVQMFNYVNGVFDYYTADMKNYVIKDVIGISFIKEA